MTPPAQTPGPVRRRWHRIVLLGLVAGIGAVGWNHYTWDRAVRQLEEAGTTARSPEHLGARLWRAAKGDWRRLFDGNTWQAPPIEWAIDRSKALPLRNLDALAPALRRINPEFLDLKVCPALQNVDGLKGLTALTELHLFGCPKLRPEQVAALKAALPNTAIIYP